MNVEVKPGYKLTEAGVIPEDWEEVLLDSVAKRGSGHTPDKKHPEYWNGSIKWVSLQDSEKLDDLYINDTAAKITPEGINNSSAVLHSAGSVVLSRDAGVGKSAILMDQMAVSQHFMAWCCGQRLDNHYLYYWMQAAKPEFERIANGSTIKTIGLPYFKELKISLPSLIEQRSIAFALSDMDALIRGLNQLIAKKRDIKHATMQQLLTGQTRLPGFIGEWKVVKAGDVGRFRGGSGFPTRLQGETSGEFPFYKVSDMNNEDNEVFMNSANNYISGSWRKLVGAAVFPAECIAFAKVGAAVFLERKKILSKPSCLDNNMAAYIFDIDRMCTRFMHYVFLGLRLGDLVSTTALPSLSSSVLSSIKLNLPPLLEQTAIATMLSDMDSELATLEARRGKAHQLKQGMMQELLTGRIRLL